MNNEELVLRDNIISRQDVIDLAKQMWPFQHVTYTVQEGKTFLHMLYCETSFLEDYGYFDNGDHPDYPGLWRYSHEEAIVFLGTYPDLLPNPRPRSFSRVQISEDEVVTETEILDKFKIAHNLYIQGPFYDISYSIPPFNNEKTELLREKYQIPYWRGVRNYVFRVTEYDNYTYDAAFWEHVVNITKEFLKNKHTQAIENFVDILFDASSWDEKTMFDFLIKLSKRADVMKKFESSCSAEYQDLAIMRTWKKINYENYTNIPEKFRQMIM